MLASNNGHLDTVRTLLECRADVNAKNNVMNQMMMMGDNYDSGCLKMMLKLNIDDYVDGVKMMMTE